VGVAARSALGARVTRAETLARRLETEIVADGLPPGERLGTKEQLRQRFGVALPTINEAIRVMEMRGLVSARPGPGGGVFVSDTASRSRLAQITDAFDRGSATLRDCVEVRDSLEPLVCIKAAESCGPSDAKAMQKIVDAMEEALGDDRAYLRLNWSLHRMIADLVTNPALFAIYRTVIDVLDDGLDDFAFQRIPRASIAVHRRLIEAIADGAPTKVVAAVARHQKNSPLALPVTRGPIT
jgi:DNA-binding FadR family transcriptional regulator